MNFSMVRYIIGFILIFEAAFMLLPLIVGIIYGETNAITAFLIVISICGALGFLMTRKRPKEKELYAREGSVSVALSWLIMSIFGALPFMLTGEIPRFADALFEAMSGFTTTGASILSDVEALSHASLFWRSFTHWIGGMGVFVFMMAILPLMGGSTMNLMLAESPGPSVSKLVPKVRDTAQILYYIYIGITVTQIIVLCICGMPLFDSFCITFGTTGTGGFAIHNDSIAGYSPLIQNIITFFMIISGINYSVYFCLLTKRFKDAFSIEEARWYLLLILGSALIIIGDIRHMYGSLEETVRHAFFQVASIITTSGFATTDFDLWPQLSKTVLIIIMLIGACAGSTGGGIKVSRIIILLRAAIKELRMVIHPREVRKVRMDGRVLTPEIIRSANAYISLYFLMLFITLLLISIDGFDLTTNFTAIATTLNNVGPGFAKVGPTCNFSMYGSFSKYVLIFTMWAGRLELFPVLMLFMPTCWKKH